LSEHVLGQLREALRREQSAEAALAAGGREIDDRFRAFDRRALRRVAVRLIERDENRMPERTRRFIRPERNAAMTRRCTARPKSLN
jgi:hypothetical protein